MSDLTWTELSNALPANTIFDDGTKGICINVSLLTGDTIDDLTDQGVVEFCYKLLNYCYAAQTTKNASLPTGSKLTAFGVPTFSAPSAGDTPTTTARHSVNAVFPVNTDIASSPLG